MTCAPSGGIKVESSADGSKGWTATGCTYAKSRGVLTRKAVIGKVCSATVDGCVFRKEGQFPVAVSLGKIEAEFPALIVAGKAACPPEADLSESINFAEIRRTSVRVEPTPITLPTKPQGSGIGD